MFTTYALLGAERTTESGSEGETAMFMGTTDGASFTAHSHDRSAIDYLADGDVGIRLEQAARQHFALPELRCHVGAYRRVIQGHVQHGVLPGWQLPARVGEHRFFGTTGC